MTKSWYEQVYINNQENRLKGRWIQYVDIAPLIQEYSNVFRTKILGYSEEEQPIHAIQFGTGSKKIMIWSQMHGNESTGTKVLFDFLNFIENNVDDQDRNEILERCTFLCIPMLNPDGAAKYTRVNAHGIDLNRDAVDQNAIESRLLRSALEDFNPDFCFNLHDQRTIFGVSGTENPATISFLAPSINPDRTLTKKRKETMNVIVAMNELMQQIIPNHIGRYTDEFYPTATGDNFQKLGYNTILIESGHFPKDYDREKSRAFTFYALLKGIHHIGSTNDYSAYEPYFSIPNNKKMFFDVVHKYLDSGSVEAFQYQELILENRFVLKLQKVEDFDQKHVIGHHEIVFESDKS